MGKRFFEGEKQVLYENKDFVKLNNKILAKAGGGWNDIPDEVDVLEAGEDMRKEIVELVKMYESQFWGFKDPRTSLTAPVYLPLLDKDGGDVYMVAIFRKPKRVAESLYRCHKVEKGRGMVLAREYARRVLKAVREFVNLGG